jgi:hypothetical protein
VDKFQRFILLVQTGCIVYDIAKVINGKDLTIHVLALHVLDEAMNLDPECIPDNLEFAAWQFIDSFYITDRLMPEWVVVKISE